MLVLRSGSELDSMTPEVCVRQLGDYNARLAIHDEFLHGAVKPNPAHLDGVGQCRFVFVWDQSTCVPTCAPVQQMEDYVLVRERTAGRTRPVC